MKKIIIVILYLLLFQLSYSQISVGIKAGMVLNQIGSITKPYNLNDINIKNSFQTGASLNFRIFKKINFIYFQSEIIYNQKKTYFIDKQNNKLFTEYYKNSTIDYIEVPLNLKMSFPLFPVFLFAGAYGAICFDGYNILNVNNKIVSNKILFSDSEISIFDFGVQAGFGFKRGISYQKYILEFRYAKGFFDIDKNKTNILYNNYLGVSLGINMRTKL